MAILKGNSADEAVKQAIVLDLGDLRRQGELVLQRAREEAVRIIAEAKAERISLISTAADEGKAQGLEQGHAEGYRQGVQEGKQAAFDSQTRELEAVATTWAAALDGFSAARQRLIDEAQRDLIGFAVAAASNITKRAIELEPSVVTDQLAAALTLVMRPSRMIIAINPEDRAVVAPALPSLLAKLGPQAHAELHDDPALARASCVIQLTDAQGGQIDASIQTQIGRLTDLLLPPRAINPPASISDGAASSTPLDPSK